MIYISKTSKRHFIKISILLILLSLFHFLSQEVSATSLSKKNISILKEITDLSNDFTLSNYGAKIYSPDTTKNLHEKLKEYNKNLSIINPSSYNEKLSDDYFCDIESGSKNYRIKKENTFNDETAIKGTIEAIESMYIPKNLVNNLKIFISPYELDKVRGYSTIYELKEAEDYIVIPSDTKYLKSNLYHELGHIYWNSVMLNNENFKNEYLKLYKGQTFNDLIWEYNIEENFAEDFKVLMLERIGISANKSTNIYYNKKVEALIAKNNKYLEKKNKLFFPRINIGNTGASINLKNKSLDTLFLEKEMNFISIEQPNDCNLVIEICNENKCYETKDTNIMLPNTSSNYKITVFYLHDRYKVEAGNLDVNFK